MVLFVRRKRFQLWVACRIKDIQKEARTSRGRHYKVEYFPQDWGKCSSDLALADLYKDYLPFWENLTDRQKELGPACIVFYHKESPFLRKAVEATQTEADIARTMASGPPTHLLRVFGR
tara:strand:+ start:3302 stop:3658 length:357 start_codon:yes stop_codon:yes gene_type:complete